MSAVPGSRSDCGGCADRPHPPARLAHRLVGRSSRTGTCGDGSARGQPMSRLELIAIIFGVVMLLVLTAIWLTLRQGL